MVRKLNLTFLLALCLYTCYSTTYTWTGTTNTNWSETTNWSPNGLPGLTDDIIVTDVTNDPILDQDRSLDDITFSSGIIDLGGFVLSCGGSSNSMTGGSFTNGNIDFSGSTSTFGGTIFNCVVSANSNNVYFNGSTFKDSLLVTKTGASTNNSNGGNVFEGYTSLTNSSSGIFRLAYVTGDSIKGKIFVHSSGSDKIHLAYNGTNVFQDSILINSTGSSSGIRFCQGTGTAKLVANKGIQIGQSGFSTGRLEIKNFTKNGTNSWTWVFTGDAEVRMESGNVINGNLTITSPTLELDGGTYNNNLTVTKNGSTDDYSAGGNTFKGTTQITNSGSGKLRLADDSDDDFQGDVTFICSSGDFIDVARDNNTTFSGDIVLQCSGTGDGIRFGNGSGTSTLATGKTITLSGDFVGELLLQGFTQTGSTLQAITQTGAGNIKFGTGTVFNARVEVNAVNMYFNGATFNGILYAFKTADATNSEINNSDGGSTFNGRSHFINQSSKLFLLAKETGDDFNASVYFIQASTGVMKPANDGVNTFSGDTILANNTYDDNIVEFTEGKGQVSLDKAGNQVLSGNLAELEFDTLKLSDGTGTVQLDTDIEIQYSVSLLILGNRVLDLNGHTCTLRNEATNAITYSSGGIESEDSDGSSEVEWDINLTTGAHIIPFLNSSGTQIPFTFNLTAGDAGQIAVYTYASNDSKSPKPAGVSNFTKDSEDATDDFANRFWQIDLSGESSPTVTTTFTYAEADLPPNGEEDGFESQRWNGSAWDAPLGSQTQNTTDNTVVTPGVTSFSPWGLSKVPIVPLPVELLFFEVQKQDNDGVLTWATGSEFNNERFEVLHSLNGIDFFKVGEVTGVGFSETQTNYEFIHNNINKGLNYYKLKQYDFDGKYTNSNIQSIKREGREQLNLMYNVVNSFGDIRFSVPKTDVQFFVFQLDGKLVYQSGMGLSNFNSAKGVYSLKAISKNDVSSFKIYLR